VSPGGPTDSEFDDLSAEGAGESGPFAFGIAGDVDPLAESDAAGGEVRIWRACQS
jgi:hypothetical protein